LILKAEKWTISKSSNLVGKYVGSTVHHLSPTQESIYLPLWSKQIRWVQACHTSTGVIVEEDSFNLKSINEEL